MSMRTLIRGVTAWVNMRLLPYDQLLNNVLMDLLTGTHMKSLVESLLGQGIKRFESFDGLSQQQKQTRFDWLLEELKQSNVVPADFHIDSRLCAMKSADHVFELLWRLICNDIWFVWDRLEYLQQDDEEILIQVPFKWTPEPPPAKKKTTQVKKTMLTGFGSSSLLHEPVEEAPQERGDSNEWVKFPGSDFAKSFKSKRKDVNSYPTPDECIMEFVTSQLKLTTEGRKLECQCLDDLVDSRVLCSLVNSFVPNTFNPDMLLNDRWTINMAIQTASQMFGVETTFDSEDLVEADPMSICSYFCALYMGAFKFRQCRAVAHRADWFCRLVRESQHALDLLASNLSNASEATTSQSRRLKSEINSNKEALVRLEHRYDVEFCRQWLAKVDAIQIKVRNELRAKIRDRFDVVTVPRNISINDLCISLVINLILTNGSGFQKYEGKEVLCDGRRLVLRDKQTGEFIDDFTSGNKASDTLRKHLKISTYGSIEIDTNDYPQYEFFFELMSRNKPLKFGSLFLYQVFPGNTLAWQKLLIKAAKENELDTVEKLVTFFKGQHNFINSRESKTLNTALHGACRYGHMEIVEFLLENEANIDAQNSFKCTPIFAAIEGMHRSVCNLLIEWGCDIHLTNIRRQKPFETVKSEDFRKYLYSVYNFYSEFVPKVMSGDVAVLDQALQDHNSGAWTFSSLGSRCVNGSTLLHTAAYFGHVSTVKDLLQCRVDVNLHDYKGASPLHRSRDTHTSKILLESGAQVNAEDAEGNTPLHVRCYGETDQLSDLDSVSLLIEKGAQICKTNRRGLTPVHCSAMQGRIDLLDLLVNSERKDEILASVNAEDEGKDIPSVIHLALVNDFVHCAQWLLDNGFKFKSKEPDLLMKKVLTEQVKISSRTEAVKFLLDNNANPDPVYSGRNRALHYAAMLPGSTDLLQLLLSHGAEVDAANADGNTAIFFATQSNNHFTASELINHGADVRIKNNQGLTPFDFISDLDEWAESGYFPNEVSARLKAYSLKHTRDLIRAITHKVKGTRAPANLRPELMRPLHRIRSPPAAPLPTPVSRISHSRPAIDRIIQQPVSRSSHGPVIDHILNEQGPLRLVNAQVLPPISNSR